jgi:hypothetical protein
LPWLKLILKKESLSLLCLSHSIILFEIRVFISSVRTCVAGVETARYKLGEVLDVDRWIEELPRIMAAGDK